MAKIYIVYDSIAAPWGDQKQDEKVYSSYQKAMADARRRVGKLKLDANILPENTGVVIEDLHGNNYIARWFVNEDGIVEKIKGGFK